MTFIRSISVPVGSRIPRKLILSSICFVLIFFAAFVSAQVVITPNVSVYPFQVLPGSTRQINVQITGGTLNTVNWSVLSTTGGASATFTTPAASDASSVSAGLATVQVNIGSTAGNCSITGSMGSYVISSPATVTIQAQSVDNPSQTAKFLFNVCAKTTKVIVAPAYQQAYKGQHRMLQSWVIGDTDETGTWSIISQPSNGNGILTDTTYRDADFVATVTGRYTLQYNSNSNSLETATAIVYVSPNAMPSYAFTSTPNQTEPRECYPDPALSGGHYEVGAGKAFTTVSSVPAITSWTPGTIMRIWNTDTTGSNPSTYHEYFQIKNTGTPTQPVIVCGVPDVLGNLPILDGSNSVGQSDISTGAAAGYGIMSVWAGPPTPYGYWQDGSSGPSYLSITGLHLRNGGPLYSYTPPGGGAEIPWVGGASCVNLRSGSYIDIGGNDMDTCTNGLFTAENANSAWVNITQEVTVTGNHIYGSGLANSATYHQVYFQSYYGVFQGNLVNNYLSTASGSDVKWRGVEGIFRYNYIGTGAARDFDLVENQDAYQYVTFEGYLGAPGDTNCVDSFWCEPSGGQTDQAGANIIAAYQESEQKDFIYGNEIFPSGIDQIHYAADNVGGMSDRNGTLYFYNNTMPGAAIVFDTGENGDGMNPIYQQRVDARNNMFWAINLTGTGSAVALDHYQTLILDATTNLFENGSMSITTPIVGGSYSGGSANGWQIGCDATCLWPLSSPINTHIYGLNSSNFLLAPPTPFNTTTLVPTAGSVAIGAGTALTGIPAQLPVRWQYSIATSSLLARADALTIGATDEGGATPLATTPIFSPGSGNYLSAQTVTISTTTPSANIYYTTDGTTPTYPITGTTEVYSGPITVNGQETVQAIATSSGYLESAVGTATYTVGITATPTFSPGSGTYTTDQTVTISDVTSGATIYYSTNEIAPTTASAVYSGPITVSNPETVQAIATASGYTASAVGSAAYTFSVIRSAPVYAQQCSGYQQYGQTVTCTLTGVGAGHVLLISVYSGTTLSSVTATAGSPASVTSISGLYAYILSNTASGSITITATATTSIARMWLGVDEYSNVPPSPLDSSAVGDCSGYCTSESTSSLTTTSATDMLWTVCFGEDGFTIGTAPITWTALPATVAGSGGVLFLEDGLAGNAGSYTGQCNGDNSTPDIITVALLGAGPVAVAPSFSPAAGTYSTTQTVTISTTTPESTIYYTTDGTTPTYPVTGTTQSYSNPISVPTSQTINAIATSTGYSNSTVRSAAYAIGTPAATPTFNPVAGTYTTIQTVTISDTTPGAVIYYTTNGTTPTTGSASYSAAVTVSANETLEAVATVNGYTQSAVGSAAYTINQPQASAPIFNPIAGTYTSIQTVTISDATPGAAIYYTTNGTTPTTSSARYSGAITVSASETLEAIAMANGYGTGSPGSAAYTVNIPSDATPSFVQQCSQYTAGNGYNNTATCTLSGVKAGDALVIGVWSADSTMNYVSSSTTPQPVNEIPSYAGAGGNNNGYMYAYILPDTPAGSITITANETGYYDAVFVSVIEFTNANTSPYDASGTGYLRQYGAYDLPSSNYTTSAANDMLWSMCSGLTGAGFTVGTAESSVAWTAGGTNTTPGDLFWQYGAAGAAGTYYGDCEKGGNGYNTDIISLAIKGASTPTAATPSLSPAAGTYTTIQTVSISDTTPGAVIYYTTDGSTATTGSAQYSGAITVASTETLQAIATASGYETSTIASAAYTINLQPASTPSFSPAAGTYGTAQSVSISDATANSTIYYTTNGSTPTTASPRYTAAISVAANETIEAIATANGYSISGTGSAAYGIAATAPTFSPVAGTYTSIQTITIRDAAAGSAIYYTTNGSTPTTGSTAYTGPIIVSATETLAAIAAVSGSPSSTVTSAFYTIQTAAALTAPTPNTSTPLTGTSITFSWMPGNTATHFEFWAGTAGPGSTNLYNSGNVTATSETVSDLPSTGETVYARLLWLIGGSWREADYRYVANGSPTQARLSTPTPDTSTPLTGTSVAFSWTPSNIVTHYEFYVGTGVGSSNLYNSGNVTATTETVSDLPSNGETLYARLYTLINGAWQYTDYTYKATGSPIAAALTVPGPNTSTPLTGTSVVFAWSPGNLATHFELYAGTTGVGSSNLYNSWNVTVTSETVSNLPSNGEKVYVRLYSLINGAWQGNDYTYTAFGSPTPAQLTTPAPNTSTPLSGTSVAFAWNPGNLATHFELWMGNTGVGSSNLYNSGNVTATSEIVSDLPSNGQTVFTRLYWLINGAWQEADYTYKAYGSPTPAALTTPSPSTQLTSTSATFAWTAGNTATNFELYLGTSVGASNLYNSGNITATSEAVNSLPSNGETIYARLYWLINGAWQYADYTYTAF